MVIRYRRSARRPEPSGEVTGHEPAPDGAERRLLGGAHLPGERASRPEPAAAGNIARVRRLTRERELERHAPAADAGDRGQERLRVGVERLLEDGGRPRPPGEASRGP